MSRLWQLDIENLSLGLVLYLLSFNKSKILFLKISFLFLFFNHLSNLFNILTIDYFEQVAVFENFIYSATIQLGQDCAQIFGGGFLNFLLLRLAIGFHFLIFVNQILCNKIFEIWGKIIFDDRSYILFSDRISFSKGKLRARVLKTLICKMVQILFHRAGLVWVSKRKLTLHIWIINV